MNSLALHPEVLAMLETQRDAKPRREMTVAETREAMRLGRKWQREPSVSVPVRDELAGGVPVRLYGDPAAGCLLYFHGGRFFSGDIGSYDWALQELAALSGCAICAVDYRLAPEHPYPAALDDARTVADWLDARSAKRAVGGDSAGGYLAARLAGPAFCWQMLIYPMLDPACASHSYEEFERGPWPSGEDMRRGWKLFGASEKPVPDRCLPPTLVVTAGCDPLRDEAFLYTAGLRAAGVEHAHWHYADMAHGFFTQTKLTRSQELLGRLAAALRSAAREA